MPGAHRGVYPGDFDFAYRLLLNRSLQRHRCDLHQDPKYRATCVCSYSSCSSFAYGPAINSVRIVDVAVKVRFCWNVPPIRVTIGPINKNWWVYATST